MSGFNVDRTITIRGSLEDICNAESKISARLRQSYEQDLLAGGPQPREMHSRMVQFQQPHGYIPNANHFNLGLHPPFGFAASASGYPLFHGSQHSHSGPHNYAGSAHGASAVTDIHTAAVGNAASSTSGMSVQNGPQSVKTEIAYLVVSNMAVGAIIGTKGSNIRSIMRASGAKIKIGQLDKKDEGNRLADRQVAITGPPEAQWQAQYYIYDKIKQEGFYGPNDQNRPRAEIFVPRFVVGRLIGRGGQNVRELQRASGAIIKVPDQNHVDENAPADEVRVQIMGNFFASQTAQRRIRALVNQAVSRYGAAQSGHSQMQPVAKQRDQQQSNLEAKLSDAPTDATESESTNDAAVAMATAPVDNNQPPVAQETG